MGERTDLAWYVAYGSNMASERLRTYLEGGTPSGALRTYDGARDPTPPRREHNVKLRGRLVFAGRSLTWTGGIAFYVPGSAGTIAARAYLLTVEQLSDLVSQELRLPVGTDLDVVPASPLSSCELPGQAYDMALRLSDIATRAAVAITTSRTLTPTVPSPSYLRWICRGLQETYGWPSGRVAAYIGRCPGVATHWTTGALVDLIDGADANGAG